MPVVNSHNDLFIQNILITPEEKVVLIDFEYFAPNYIFLDMVNFILEGAIDYSKPNFSINSFDEKKLINKNHIN